MIRRLLHIAIALVARALQSRRRDIAAIAPPRALARVRFALQANSLAEPDRALVLELFRAVATDHHGEPDAWNHAAQSAVDYAAVLARRAGSNVLPFRRPAGRLPWSPPTPRTSTPRGGSAA